MPPWGIRSNEPGLAVPVGGLIGLKCGYHYKPAGFRTIILITFGSTLYTLFSIFIAVTADSTTRIVSNIVTGIGLQRAHFLYFLNVIGGKIRIGP